jgi:putative ABC transport system permease protein
VSEVALAIMLLVGASLLVRSFALMQRVDPGFSARSLLTFRLSRPAVAADAREGFYEGLVDRLRGVSGVRAVTIANNVPAAGRGNSAWFNMIDRPTPADSTPPVVLYRIVSLDYFRTIGLPLTRGRLFDSGDGLKRAHAVIVNETLARTFYPDRDPLGRQVDLGAPENHLIPPSTIVGIVGDVHETGLGRPVLPAIYVPHALMPAWSAFSFLIDTQAPADTVLANARAIVHEADPGAPMTAVSTISDVLDQSLVGTRSSMTLITMFASTALALTLVGVFGVLSHSVQQRTRELGIRLALGARPAGVRWLVLRRGLIEIGAGVTLGFAGAWLLTTLIQSLLFGVSARDPWSFILAAGILAACALVACDIPARRAARVDPLQTLRLD